MAEGAVLDVDSPEEGDRFFDMVRQRFDPIKLYRSTVSPVVGSHAGPGSIGLVFYADA
jgi:fatty acid-binding protein DegV